MLFAGLLLSPSIILQQNLAVKSVQTVLFFTLAMLSVAAGRRRLVVGSSIFIATTIMVNLLSPVGKLLVQIGPLRITRGALEVGIAKATTLVSLLYVSRICVRPSVRLPGTVGSTIAQTFDYLSRLLARGRRISRKNLVQNLDEQFEEILEDKDGPSGNRTANGNTVSGIVVLSVLLIANWAALFFPFSALLEGL
jgi:hypothetical protein